MPFCDKSRSLQANGTEVDTAPNQHANQFATMCIEQARGTRNVQPPPPTALLPTPQSCLIRNCGALSTRGTTSTQPRCGGERPVRVPNAPPK